MSKANQLADDEQFLTSLDEPTSDENRPSRLEMVALLKDRPVNDPATRLLLRFFQDSDWLVHAAAFEALKARLDVAKHLLADFVSLLGSEEPTPWRVCELLSELRSDASAVLEKIQELEPNEIVAKTIWKIGGKTDLVIPMIVQLMKEPSEELCDLIDDIGPDASPTVPSLIRALQIDEHDADLKWAAVDALGAIGPKAVEAVPALVQLLNYGSGLVAGHTAHTLALIGPASVPALIGALKSDDARKIESAADALSQIGEPAKPAAPYLKELLNHQSTDVVGWTAVALAKITNEKCVVPILVQVINQATNASNQFLQQKAAEILQEWE